MPPPNLPARPTPPGGRPRQTENEASYATGPDALSPTRHFEPSLLELDELLVEMPTIAGNAPGAPPLLPIKGDLIGGTYRVERELGSGAMGVVLLAVDQRLNRKVAIKLIQSALFAEHYLERFLQEARAMAEVTHPNLLVIHAFGEHQSAPYFVTEFVSGTTLDRVIANGKSAVDLDTALRILDEICAGVAALHSAGLVHRDLKPANILLDRELSVRVADFGLVQNFASAKAAIELVGTLGYIAPELTHDAGPGAAASPRSDVYSVGCIAYELLTGKPPFDSRSDDSLIMQHATSRVVPPSLLRSDLPAALDLVVLRALAKDPARRTPGMAELRAELRAVRVKGLQPTRILIADDDPDFRLLLELKLRSEFPDADVEAVADGEAALAAFDRHPASVVILDLQMPILDGREVTEALRSRPDSAAVPILILTASGGPEAWKLLSSLGADRLLVKPVDLDDVVAIVRRTFKSRSEIPPPLTPA